MHSLCRENKDANQLCGNRAADLCLCFSQMQKDVADISPIVIGLEPVFADTEGLELKHHVHQDNITCPCNLYPLASEFYMVKLGFTGVYFSYFCSKILIVGTR